MLIRYQIYEVIVNHPFYVSIITVVLGYGILHILRQRRHRRDENEVSIPDFLRKGPDSSDHGSSSIETDWLEVHPLPRKIR